MYNRNLGSQILSNKKSALILGPRQVGKSTLISGLKPHLTINLAEEQEYFTFQTELSELERRIAATNAKTIFIDEIQRIPRLTNSIQALIDNNPKLRFFLTGSSARKLRKGKANLLPGRLISYQLMPMCLDELMSDWNESAALSYGSLPGIITTKSITEKKLILRSYASTYLKEEIMAEALVRQIDGFVRFINAAAIDSGLYLDYSKLSKKAKVPRQSVSRHFEILEDTLIAKRVGNDPDIDLDKADLIKHPRFFFFDLGVVNAIRGSFDVSQERIGFLFEHLVFNQIVNSCTGNNLDYELYNFKTRGGFEVDFIAKIEGTKFAIECKSSMTISTSEVNTINRIDDYYSKIKKIIIYRGTKELKDSGVWILPLKKALEVLTKG